jgi:hypothetical protein
MTDPNGIIAGVTPKLVIVLLFSCFVIACNKAPESRDAVRQGILDHLSKNTGLDLKSIDVDVNNVSFQGEKATAAVSFKPKSSPEAGMSMNYTLERQGAKWIVQKTAGSGGHGGAMSSPESTAPPAGGLPAGHPPVGASPQGGGSAPAVDLPAGHPPVTQQPAPSKK